jgi:hypothetical protein
MRKANAQAAAGGGGNARAGGAGGRGWAGAGGAGGWRGCGGGGGAPAAAIFLTPQSPGPEAARLVLELRARDRLAARRGCYCY